MTYADTRKTFSRHLHGVWLPDIIWQPDERGEDCSDYERVLKRGHKTMRRSALIVAVLVIAIAFTSLPQAKADGPFKKLGRGLLNIIVSPLEIPMSVSKTNDQHDPIWAVTVGAANGLGACIERAGAGVVQVATFLVPRYDKPVLSRKLGETELTTPEIDEEQLKY